MFLAARSRCTHLFLDRKLIPFAIWTEKQCIIGVTVKDDNDNEKKKPQDSNITCHPMFNNLSSPSGSGMGFSYPESTLSSVDIIATL